MAAEADVLLSLPADLREDLKEPLGPIHRDLASLLEDLARPLITVGDVVSYHCEEAGHRPDLAIIDGRTKRSAVDPEIEQTLATREVERIDASNPAGTITASLLEAIAAGLETDEAAQVVVDGEEDLAALPAILLAPSGANVLYGQPDEGVVQVAVTSMARTRAREFLFAMEGDHDRVAAMLAS